MANSTFLLALTGVVPAVCDAEAGECATLSTDVPRSDVGLGCCFADPLSQTCNARVSLRRRARPESASIHVGIVG